MKPSSAYSTSYNNNKLFLSLFALLLIQSIIYILLNVQIILPNSIKNQITNLLFKNYDLTSSDVKFRFPNRLFIERLNSKSTDNSFLFENLNITLDLNFGKPSIRQVCFEKCFVLTKEENKYSIKNFFAYKRNSDYMLTCNLFSKHCEINFKGLLNQNDITQHKFQKSDTEHPSYLFNFLEKINQYFQKNSFQKKIKLRTNFSLKRGGFVNIEQIGDVSHLNFLNGLSVRSKFKNSTLQIFNLNIKAKDVKFGFKNQSIKLFDCDLIYKNYGNFNNSNSNSNFDLKVKNINLFGKFDGNLSPISIISEFNKNNQQINIFSNSNATKISNNIIFSKNNIDTISGFNVLNPKSINLAINAHDSRYKFIDGEKVQINFSKLHTPKCEQLSFIKIKATNFSALESPIGNYKASGYLKQNLELDIDNIKCNINNDKVTGSYKQCWNPHRYKFILNGHLIPTTINNWLDDWWDNIWSDFVFDNNITPYGDFVISGDWTKPSDTVTYGLVNSKNFKYKNLSINDTKLEITADHNSTTFQTNSLLHSLGKLSGSISIYNKRSQNNKSIEFKVIGSIPINNSKKIFGPVVESYLKDFNLSDGFIKAQGYIPIKLGDANYSNSNYNYINIDFNTDKNSTWNDVKIERFNCHLSSDFQITKLLLPSIKLPDGKLTFNTSINNDNGLTSFNFDLIDANIKNVIQSLYDFQNSKNIEIIKTNNLDFISNDGIVNLKLNAHGSINDIGSFKGTGKIKVVDKELRKLDLLGFLSKSLSEIPIPFPTGTLNFQTLEGLFELDNNEIQFDQLILSGLISKVENRGSINLINGNLDIISKIQLIGNLPIPIIKQFAQLADPLSSITEIKLTGSWLDPKWKLFIKPLE